MNSVRKGYYIEGFKTMAPGLLRRASRNRGHGHILTKNWKLPDTATIAPATSEDIAYWTDTRASSSGPIFRIELQTPIKGYCLFLCWAEAMVEEKWHK